MIDIIQHDYITDEYLFAYLVYSGNRELVIYRKTKTRIDRLRQTVMEIKKKADYLGFYVRVSEVTNNTFYLGFVYRETTPVAKERLRFLKTMYKKEKVGGIIAKRFKKEMIVNEDIDINDFKEEYGF